MGKSDKRVKSEKLNFLRKQYEAFLEEDRKRKERNEYILGRLDEMRSCTALVTQNKLSVRVLNACQPGPLISTRRSDRSVIPLYNSTHTHSQFKCTTPTTVDIPTKTSQEALFLQEIVKKYILIPKSEYYSDSSTAESADWKSKYEILNHLKDIETDNVPTREDVEFVKTDRNDISLKPLQDELPVKDDLIFKVKSRQSSIDIKAQSELTNKYDYSSTSLQHAPKKHDEIRSQYINYDKIDIDNISKIPLTVEHKIYEYNTNVTNTESREIFNVTSRVQKPVNKHDRSDMISQEKTLGKEKVDLVTLRKHNEIITNPDQNNYDYSETETINKTQPTNENLSPKAEDGTMIDENEYPMEIINVSDFTPNDGVKLQDGVNVNPEGYHIAASMYNEPEIVNYESNDYTEPGTVDYDNGSEFSTIQQKVNYEYSAPQIENSGEYNEPRIGNTSNLEYNKPQTTINDQNNLEQVTNLASITQTETKENTDKNGPEYNEINNQVQEYNPAEPLTVENAIVETAIEEFEAEQRDMFYQPQDENINPQEGYPENYEENQYHQYYEGAEQAPVEINEHEEATQPYDQNYEAQYGAYEQPGYEQQVYGQQSQPEQPGYEQQQTGYEQQHQPGYEQQQVYDQQAVSDQQQVYDHQSQPEQQVYEQGYYEQQQYDQSQYNQEQNYDQQAYDQLQYEQITEDSPQGIEQQLDDEQGYVEPNPINQDVEIKIRNDAEKVNEHVVNPNPDVQEGKEQIEALKNPS